MLWSLFLSLAGAAEVDCELRGLPVRIAYDAAGEVVVYDGDEVLAVASAGPIDVEGTKASCAGDRFRMVQGSNVAGDGSHATLSLNTLEMDLGPVLDALPAERFDPRQSNLRKARRAASSGQWTTMQDRLAAYQPLASDERDRLVEVLLHEGSREALEHAWAMVEGSDSVHRKEAGLTLLRLHVTAEDLGGVAALAAALPEEPEACEWSGRLQWMDGKKGKARKTWATCMELSDEVLAWCETCG